MTTSKHVPLLTIFVLSIFFVLPHTATAQCTLNSGAWGLGVGTAGNDSFICINAIETNALGLDGNDGFLVTNNGGLGKAEGGNGNDVIIVSAGGFIFLADGGVGDDTYQIDGATSSIDTINDSGGDDTYIASNGGNSDDF